MFKRNPILATDSYKASHFRQYPPGTQGLSSYMSARGTKEEGVTGWIYFGGQFFVQDVLSQKVTQEHIEEADAFFKCHGIEFNRAGWQLIVDSYGGNLPVVFSAVPEGTFLPFGVAAYRMEVANDPDLFFLISHLESLALSYTWYGSTVATKGLYVKKAILENLLETSDEPYAGLDFKLHDFGFRGVIPNGGYIGGAAHLVNFKGTDTMEGMLGASQYYKAGFTDLGFSIPASEHSTMTSWGREHEYEAYKNMVDQYAKPGAIFACVIDSYDTFGALDMWADDDNPEGKSLLDRVREAGATVVLRPDSGHPVDMPVDVIRWLVNELSDEITFNKKGYIVLPKHVRVIQGDGIGPEEIVQILKALKGYQISGDNIAFGMGGGLLQKVNRDTFKMAQKCSSRQDDEGVWHDVVKDPKTDPTKKSKAGRVITVMDRTDRQIKTITMDEYHEDVISAGFNGTMRYASLFYTMYDGTTWGGGVLNTNLNEFRYVRSNAREALERLM